MLTQLSFPQGANIPGTLGNVVTASPQGAVIFVRSTGGADTKSRLKYFGAGTSQSQGSVQGPQGDPNYPLATVFGTNGALSYCLANRGDLIVVLPGHTENLTTNGSYAIAAGVTIIGIGGKGIRPSFVYAGGTSTVITPGAGVVLNNLHFDLCTNNASISLVKGFNFTGAGASMIGCRLLVSMATATHTALNAITIAAADITIAGCDIDGTLLTGAASAIAASAPAARLSLLGNIIRGFWSTAAVVSSSTFFLTAMVVDNNYFYQANGTAKAIVSLTTSDTGIFRNNTFIGTTWATAADAIAGGTNVGLRWTQNFGFDDGAGAVSGVLVPAVGTIA